MSPRKQFLFTSIFASSLAVWFYLVTQVTPNRSSTEIIILFFLSLLVWLASGLAFIFYTYKVKRDNREVIYAHMNTSIRQGIIVSVTITGLLFLQFLRVINWWEALLIVITACLFELGFRSTTTKKGML